MKAPYDLDRVKLLHEAPALIALAIKRGWMSYPHSVRISALGTPMVVLEPDEDYEVTATAQDADVYMVDEPSSYLDVRQRLKAAQVIRGLLEPKVGGREEGGRVPRCGLSPGLAGP